MLSDSLLPVMGEYCLLDDSLSFANLYPAAPPPGFDPKVDSNYNYVPTEWICITFVVLFSLTASKYLLTFSPYLR